MHKFFLLAAVASAVAFLLLVSGRQPDSKDAVSASSFMENVKVVNMKNGMRQWALNTEKAVFLEGGDTASLNGVTVDIPSQGMTVRADEGTYNTQNNDLSLSGDVRASTHDFMISTSQIHLDSTRGGLYTEDYVIVEGGSFRIEGKGLDAEDNTVKLLSDVKATFF